MTRPDDALMMLASVSAAPAPPPSPKALLDALFDPDAPRANAAAARCLGRQHFARRPRAGDFQLAAPERHGVAPAGHPRRAAAPRKRPQSANEPTGAGDTTSAGAPARSPIRVRARGALTLQAVLEAQDSQLLPGYGPQISGLASGATTLRSLQPRVSRLIGNPTIGDGLGRPRLTRRCQ